VVRAQRAAGHVFRAPAGRPDCDTGGMDDLRRVRTERLDLRAVTMVLPLPLPYAGRGPAGARQEMARILGVSAAERPALAETVAAVLDRDPREVASLRAELCARRDAAASTLAFEFAARIQEEIEAVDWITAEQKVTRPAPSDFDMYGWSDGTLLRFAVRGGRLMDWTRRACAAAPAARHLAGTPAEWAGFTRRNAELAARLAG